jgi:hypothetical protein
LVNVLRTVDMAETANAPSKSAGPWKLKTMCITDHNVWNHSMDSSGRQSCSM